MARAITFAGRPCFRPSSAVLALLAVPVTAAGAQDYRSSVVGTDFDFIRESDPSTFLCLESKGRGPREMPDKTGPSDLIQEAFIFVSYYDDGTEVDMALDVDFETEEAARREALRYVPRLGKLPTALRAGVERLVVHRGEEDATAFSDSGLIVVYSANATKRISTHDLEETIFHEAVHAAWDDAYEESPAWKEAQASDGAFVTRYGQENPDREDLAESALFAYTLLHHPDRIPEPHGSKIRDTIPARITFVEGLLPPQEPIFHPVGPPYACDGSGVTFTVAAEPGAGEPRTNAIGCIGVDRTTARGVSDLVSNALMRGLHQPERAVSSFLAQAKEEYSTADELIEAAAVEFIIDEAALREQVQAFYHVNCKHEAFDDSGRRRITFELVRMALDTR